jgi:short-subunit dehydrogenase
MKSLILIGPGPKVGLPIARRFAKEGMAVGLIARSQATLADAERELSGLGATVATRTADTTDEAGLRTALSELIDAVGVPDALVYNTARVGRDALGEFSAAEQLAAWHVNVVGALTAAAYVGPRMADRGSGTILITGGKPLLSKMVSLTLGKAGVRALVDILDDAYGEAGVHAATVKICSAVVPGTECDPDEVAELYWRLHSQPRESWESEIVYPSPA